MSPGSEQVVPFDTAIANENGCFSFGADPRFTAPASGRYDIRVGIGVQLTGAGGVFGFGYFRVFRFNAAGTQLGLLRPSGTVSPLASSSGWGSLTGGGVMYMDASDYLVFRVYSNLPYSFFGSNPAGEFDYLQIMRLT
jgi:hypothetical protein